MLMISKKLLEILNRIVENGDTVIVIEHNLDVIKVADYIIDLGQKVEMVEEKLLQLELQKLFLK